MSKSIELLTRGICIKAGKLLVCHTRGARITYLPGGHIEFGENARNGLARELLEELGCRARVGAFLGAIEHIFRQNGRKVQEMNLVFAVDIPAITAKRCPNSSEGHLDFQWLNLSDISSSNLEPAPIKTWLSATGLRKTNALWASTIE
jgi:8-oxo-dGTP diphosphatase